MLSNILSQSAFWVVNKKLAVKIGLEETILLSDLITKQQYFLERGELTDGFFYNTSENLTKDTGLTYYQQKSRISKLEKLELIETNLIGMPAKLHFKIQENNVLSVLEVCTDRKEDVKTTNSKTKEFKNKHKDDFTSAKDVKEGVNKIYDFYPTKCVIRGSNTGKSKKNKNQIDVLLKTNTIDELIYIIEWYVDECKKSNVYMKNFSTFLNNLPELPKSDTLKTNKNNKEIRALVRWLSTNYRTKYADEVSNEKANELAELGYTNEDFLNRFRL